MTKEHKMVFVQTIHHPKYPCQVCGESRRRVSVLCVPAEGDFESVRICEACLEEGNIDERLEAQAAHLEAAAVKARKLIGRIVAPSYETLRKVRKIMDRELDDDVPF